MPLSREASTTPKDAARKDPTMTYSVGAYIPALLVRLSTHRAATTDGRLERVIGRFAEGEARVLYVDYSEGEKCEFIKANAPKEDWEAWSSTDGGAGLIVRAHALRMHSRSGLANKAKLVAQEPKVESAQAEFLRLQNEYAQQQHPSSGQVSALWRACGLTRLRTLTLTLTPTLS